MSLTTQKLQYRIAELGKAAEGQEIAITPVYVALAQGPMTPPPTVPFTDTTQWRLLEKGQQWGKTHSTSWLTAQLPATTVPTTVHLDWNTSNDDSLLLLVEATVFLDGYAIGGLDYRHLFLLLPERACDGQPYTITIQAYTSVPQPFGGLTLRHRNTALWQLYSLMHTVFEALHTMSEHGRIRHALLEQLNAAYTMLDLREGWESERFLAAASSAYDYLQASLKEYPEANDQPHITVSGHAHLDIGWMWPYWRTRQKIAHTVSNVLNLMDRFPQFHYSQSQPQVLQWLKEDMPELYERVKQRVAEGRFELVGAMWVETDCNLTSGESLVRQIMHGTRFIQQEFGITPRHIWLPDVFGYSAALPQIMRGCDIPVFMTTKISWNQFNRMPCDTFRWRGIDGSEVLTHFVTAPDLHSATTYYTYNGPLRPQDMTGTWENYRQQALNDRMLYLAGWGDGGGGPAEEQLQTSQVMADLPNFPVVRWGSVDAYFSELYARVWDHPHLPRWVGELYLEYHRGTYTSQARMKQLNRRSELFYREIELLNAWASLYGMPSRQEQLNTGWQRLLLNQFHDVLPGSSIREVYDDAERIYAEARSIGEEIRSEALDVLCEHFGITKQGIAFFNTLPWERTEPLQVAGSHMINVDGTQKATDWDGNAIVLVDGVSMPPCGASIFSEPTIAPDESSEQTCSVSLTKEGYVTLHNTYYDLVLNTYGEIQRLYDKRVERDVFVEGQMGNQLIAYEDRPLNFDAWDIDLFYEEKPYALHDASSIRVIERGPVRVTVEVERHYLASRITQRISLWRTSPRIDIATEIDWHEHQTVLKAAFPLAINSARATYEIQFGSVERPTHRNTSWDMARFEVCAHRWADVSEGNYGVSLLNDSKYGHDCHDNMLRLTLLKSSIFPDPNADQGIHRFTYSLLPHQGDWREAQTVRHAYELNVPAFVLSNVHAGKTSEHIHDVLTIEAYSLVYTDCDHVVVETVKPAEDDDGLIVRLYEAHNQRGYGTLTFATALNAVQECSLLELPLQEVPHMGNSFAFQVRPFEIKTFRVRLDRA
ncbi:MAG: alpha-mannosidase [Ktedonobacteraceae bacterium]